MSTEEMATPLTIKQLCMAVENFRARGQNQKGLTGSAPRQPYPDTAIRPDGSISQIENFEVPCERDEWVDPADASRIPVLVRTGLMNLADLGEYREATRLRDAITENLFARARCVSAEILSEHHQGTMVKVRVTFAGLAADSTSSA